MKRSYLKSGCICFLVLVILFMPLFGLSASADEFTASGGLKITTSTKYYKSGWTEAAETDTNIGKSTASFSSQALALTAHGAAKDGWFYAATWTVLTVTFTNNSNSAKTLNFTVSKLSVNAITTSSNDTLVVNQKYAYELAAGGQYTITITTGSDTIVNSCTLSDIALVGNDSCDTTFLAVENGSYTVNGDSITKDTTLSQTATTAYTLNATPASGYQFLGWFSTTANGYISYNASLSAYIDASTTIYPVFTASDLAIFEVGDTRFDSLTDANQAAKNHTSKQITLVHSGVVIAGTYEISTGVKLLIPFDAIHTANFSPTTTYSQTSSTPTEYACLTLPSGTTINCYGSINVNATQYANSGQYTSNVIGAYGAINMDNGSQINMKSGSNLYAYGYIGGEGLIISENGSNVYQFMQVTDWRGGSNSSELIKDKYLKQNSFIISQYYIQNIECNLRVYSGANMHISFSYSMTNILDAILGSEKTPEQLSVPLMGTNSGLFYITSGYLQMKYDSGTDRTTLDIHGDVTVANITLAVKLTSSTSTTINSSDFIMPLPMNYTINVNSGHANFSQRFKIMPGTVLNINEGATASVKAFESDTEQGGALYLYDKDDWNSGNYTYTGKIFQLGYVYGTADHKPVTRTVNTDAVLKVDGTLIANGPVYSTDKGENGSNAKITGTGTFISKVHGATNLKEVNGSSTDLVDIACVPAVGNLYDKQAVDSFGINTYYGFNDSNGKNYWYNVYTQMVLGSSLDMRLAFPTALFRGTPTASVADKKIALGTDTIGKAEYYFFTIQDIAAAEMGTKFTITVSDGDTQIGQFTESIQSYAERMLKDAKYANAENGTTEALARTMLVDMLNYGAAVQTYFAEVNGTEPGTLPNSSLTAEQKAWGSTADFTGIESGTSTYTAALQISGNINLLINFDGVANAAYARVDFDSHWDDVVDYLSGQIYSTEVDGGVVTVDRLLIADARQSVTVTLYDASGKKIGDPVTDSIAAYLKRMHEASDSSDALKNLCEATLCFSDSAKAFLHARWEAPITGTVTPYEPANS